jgi:signal transduction histidine kinase
MMRTDTNDKVNILLVDDQPAKLLAYEAMLTDLGLNLIKASSGREALEHLLKSDITIVLMDVSMPEIDGFELAEIIRQHPRYQKTAIIFVSAVHLTDLDRLKGYESGAVDYVSVPVVPALLRAKVSVFAELYRKTREFERLNRELEERVAERTVELEAAMTKQTELADKLREADRRKDEFLALLAHELRNPLAPVRNAAGIMRIKGAADPDLVRWCDVIDRQTDHLKRLVDDLLDVSRITQGKVQLRFETVEVATIIAGAVETCAPLIEKRRHRIRRTLPDAPLLVRADPFRLTQIVANLVSNAAKFQDDEGEIAIVVRREGDDAVITITDRGMGLSEPMLSEAFELFSQGDHAPDRSQGGLGIGLSLVRKLVEMHGGSVGATSEGLGRGCTFVVRIPVEQGATAAAADAAPVMTAGIDKVLRILVVDDNRDAAEGMAMWLQLQGHDVAMAHDGHHALEVAAAERPAVVLLDIGLPGMDGYEVCQRIRRLDTPQPIVIALTGYGQDEDRRRAIAAGFDDHTVKPVDLDKLTALLAAAADR